MRHRRTAARLARWPCNYCSNSSRNQRGHCGHWPLHIAQDFLWMVGGSCFQRLSPYQVGLSCAFTAGMPLQLARFPFCLFVCFRYENAWWYHAFRPFLHYSRVYERFILFFLPHSFARKIAFFILRIAALQRTSCLALTRSYIHLIVKFWLFYQENCDALVTVVRFLSLVRNFHQEGKISYTLVLCIYLLLLL
jgi:hypothetical protein